MNSTTKFNEPVIKLLRSDKEINPIETVVIYRIISMKQEWKWHTLEKQNERTCRDI